MPKNNTVRGHTGMLWIWDCRVLQIHENASVGNEPVEAFHYRMSVAA